MNTAAQLLLVALTLALSCSGYATPSLPQNPGLTDALKPAALPGPEKLGLATLEERLLQTSAIAEPKKLALKAEIEDLQALFKAAHAGGAPVEKLRPAYDRLIAKVQAAVKKDVKLSRDLKDSKEAIWSTLADPGQYASLAH